VFGSRKQKVWGNKQNVIIGDNLSLSSLDTFGIDPHSTHAGCSYYRDDELSFGKVLQNEGKAFDWNTALILPRRRDELSFAKVLQNEGKAFDWNTAYIVPGSLDLCRLWCLC